jgi:AbiV family abortive infection protein
LKDKQYKSSITPRQASEGIKICCENAKSLFEDAKLLFENKRFERALALSILAIEEAGKVNILRGILTEDDPKELKKKWQNYRKHTEKNVMWDFPRLVLEGARNLEDFKSIFDNTTDNPQTLDNLKQLSFYTDAFANCKWTHPKGVIDEKLTKSILNVAKILVEKPTSMTTEKELEIWVKHMKPAKNKDINIMKESLINCYKEAESLGLVEFGLSESMRKFVYKQSS